MDTRWRKNFEDKVPDNFKNIGPERKRKDENKPNKGKGNQCHECEGFGHVKVECPTFLKKQKNGMSITLSNQDDESEEETTNKMVAFTGKYEFGSESSDEEITDEECGVRIWKQ